MIGQLRGVVARKGVESVIIDVQGVGYEVVCPLTVLDQLPAQGQTTTLSIHTHAREDQLTLFAFIDVDQRALFRLLISVSGVGPKLAMACLSGMSADAFCSALMSEDVKKLSSVPGIGKRTAQRLTLELKDKVKHLGASTPGGTPRPQGGNAHLDDLDSALRNLGYRAKAVETLIDSLRAEAEQMSFEALLREALRRLNG